MKALEEVAELPVVKIPMYACWSEGATAARGACQGKKGCWPCLVNGPVPDETEGVRLSRALGGLETEGGHVE